MAAFETFVSHVTYNFCFCTTGFKVPICQVPSNWCILSTAISTFITLPAICGTADVLVTQHVIHDQHDRWPIDWLSDQQSSFYSKLIKAKFRQDSANRVVKCRPVRFEKISILLQRVYAVSKIVQYYTNTTNQTVWLFYYLEWPLNIMEAVGALLLVPIGLYIGKCNVLGLAYD